MGIFKRKKKKVRPFKYNYNSNSLEKMIIDDEAADAEKEKVKNTHAIELYDAIDKVREEKKKSKKVDGRPDYETRKKQEQSKLDEEKYDHLLNSVQAQTLIQAVEKNYETDVKKKDKDKDDSDEPVIINAKKLGTHDMEVYVKQQCDIMEAAAGYIENVKAEYEAVTEEFNDIQLIDEAPADIRTQIISCAEKIDSMMVDRRILKSTEHKLSNYAYRKMETFEEEIPSDLKLMYSQEEFYDAVRQDLRVLEGERMNLRLESKALVKRQLKIKSLARTAFVAMVIVFAVFIASMIIIENEADTELFTGVSLFAAILAVGMFAILKVTERNVLVTENKLNKATMLLNKIKIKYVNAANTLDYEYSKYGVKSAYELENKFNIYKEMKEEQSRMIDMTASLNSAENELENILKRLGVNDVHIWFGRVKALINPKEMVEVRHELNSRRYKLRQQIEYNEKRIEEAKSNIKRATLSNPEHSDGAMRVIEMYEKRHSRVAK